MWSTSPSAMFTDTFRSCEFSSGCRSPTVEGLCCKHPRTHQSSEKRLLKYSTDLAPRIYKQKIPSPWTCYLPQWHTPSWRMLQCPFKAFLGSVLELVGPRDESLRIHIAGNWTREPGLYNSPKWIPGSDSYPSLRNVLAMFVPEIQGCPQQQDGHRDQSHQHQHHLH